MFLTVIITDRDDRQQHIANPPLLPRKGEYIAWEGTFAQISTVCWDYEDQAVYIEVDYTCSKEEVSENT